MTRCLHAIRLQRQLDVILANVKIQTHQPVHGHAVERQPTVRSTDRADVHSYLHEIHKRPLCAFGTQLPA
jgi:hypothetical protein